MQAGSGDSNVTGRESPPQHADCETAGGKKDYDAGTLRAAKAHYNYWLTWSLFAVLI